MDQHLKDCLVDRVPGEYILPFFWQHGEDHQTLSEEIEAMAASGIREFCVESRTHEKFGEDEWWVDFGFMLEEAKKRDMRVWLLDDKHFPTGYANLYIEKHPELRMLSLRMDYRDFAGPRSDMSILPVALDPEEEYLSIVAYRRESGERELSGDGIDLLPYLKDGLIFWDIPEGFWRIFYVITTRRTFIPGRQYYINMLDPESCKAMLYAVYQPHFDHFKDYFGNTFAGFFSDEPCFENDGYTYYCVLGREGILVPWSKGFEETIAREAGCSGKDILMNLPFLWQNHAEKVSLTRESYMEAASKAFRDNFSYLLGNWCRERGVEYIGHIIEDGNVHQRLGCGPGHYFRALEGQDMAGIDIVLHQVVPGFNDLPHTAACSTPILGPDFFRDTLPKLGSSHAHIQPLKKGRAMCEIFGAFGWAEGLWEMKGMTDLMLSGGINHFVPHAFTPKYPDYDCPPHFYARGHNSQFGHFKALMSYMNRGAHLLSGGIHRAGAAVYYNAEDEWAAGKGMLISDVCPLLARAQIDFDIIPADTLKHDASVKDGRLLVNQEDYRLLVVPYSEILPVSVIQAFDKLSREGLPIWFVNGLPKADQTGAPLGDRLMLCQTVSADTLALKASAMGLKAVTTQRAYPHLRVFHIDRKGESVYMLWNSDIFTEIDDRFTFPSEGHPVFYDAWLNALTCPDELASSFRVRLAPKESIFVIFGKEQNSYTGFDYRDEEGFAPSVNWTISVKAYGEEDFTPLADNRLRNLAREMPRFSGLIKYETDFFLGSSQEVRSIDLGSLSESAEVFLNGQSLGVLVSVPYRLPLSGERPGKNHLEIIVAANMGYSERDSLSTYIPMPPMGLSGPVLLVE